MEAILGELQGKSGVTGALIIGEKGRTIAHSSVESEKLGVDIRQKLDKLLKFGYKNNPFDHIIFESENGKILVYNLSKSLLVICVTKTVNPLLIHSIVKNHIQKLSSKSTEAVPFQEQVEAETEKVTLKAEAELKKPLTKPEEKEDIPNPEHEEAEIIETATETGKLAITQEELEKLSIKHPHAKKTASETGKLAITQEELEKLAIKYPHAKKTASETEKPKPRLKLPETKPVEMEKQKTINEKQPDGDKQGMEEIGRGILTVNTSSFPANLDLILHLRSVYGSDRFLATRLLDFNGREIREISREMKISVEAIVDFIGRDPAIFSIKLHR